MDSSFWDTLNSGLSTVKTGAFDYLDFVKTQRLNDILTNTNTQAGQIYTIGQAQGQTGAITSSIRMSYLVAGGIFLLILLYIISQ